MAALVRRFRAVRVVEEVGSAHRDPALLDSGERNLSYVVPSGFRAPVGYKQTHDSDDGVDGQLEHAHVPSVGIAAQAESAAGMAVAYIEWVECNLRLHCELPIGDSVEDLL